LGERQIVDVEIIAKMGNADTASVGFVAFVGPSQRYPRNCHTDTLPRSSRRIPPKPRNPPRHPPLVTVRNGTAAPLFLAGHPSRAPRIARPFGPVLRPLLHDLALADRVMFEGKRWGGACIEPRRLAADIDIPFGRRTAVCACRRGSSRCGPDQVTRRRPPEFCG
jgi:hypothetical protein